MTSGTLYGLGVGPGDPELLTLKAVRILGEVDVVFAAASTKNDFSNARDIAAPHLRPHAELVQLGFPMTKDTAALTSAWKDNAALVASRLQKGHNAAFLTLGDPMIYSTFGYLLEELQAIAPQAPVRIVPGVTSFQAAAAATRTVLVEAGESLVLTSGQADAERFGKLCRLAENAVVLKAYKNFRQIKEMLRQCGAMSKTLFCSRLGMEGERICDDLDDVQDTPHYFSLVLVKRNHQEPGNQESGNQELGNQEPGNKDSGQEEAVDREPAELAK